MISLLRKLGKSIDTEDGSCLSSGGIANQLNIDLGYSYCFLSTGRSAISYLIARLNLTVNDTVIMPAYVAEGVIYPFIAAGVKIRFYKLTHQLFPDMDDITQLLNEDKSVRLCIVIHPLGFIIPLLDLKNILIKNKILLLEDCAQALFSTDYHMQKDGVRGDFAIYSLNKFLPVPDGSFLVSHIEMIDVRCSVGLPTNESAINCYMEHLLENELLSLENNYTKAKRIFLKTSEFYERYYDISGKDLQIRYPSYLTRRVFSQIDLSKFKKQRVHNTNFLYNNLRNSYVSLCFENFLDEIIPMAVPMRVEKKRRSFWVNSLMKKGILLSTLYDKWNFVPKDDGRKFYEESDYMESHLLVPINEFISLDKMAYMVNEINKLV